MQDEKVFDQRKDELSTFERPISNLNHLIGFIRYNDAFDIVPLVRLKIFLSYCVYGGIFTAQNTCERI